MVDKLKYYYSVGVRGLIYCVVPTNFHYLFIFVQSKLQWNSEADVEVLIDEFMKNYYGPASTAIRLELQSEFWYNDLDVDIVISDP